MAQNTSSLAGRVIDPSGGGVDAMVSATGPSGLVRRVSTLPDGTFKIGGLPAGNYLLCAEATMDNPKMDPFVNSCFWLNPESVPYSLAVGKALAGISLVLQRGQRLLVRVNDPGKLLPAPVGRNSGNHLSIMVANGNGIQRRIPIASIDSGGRTHFVAIPNGESHKLSIRSALFSLKDGQGRGLDSTKPSAILATTGTALATVVVNVSAAAVKP